MTARQLTSTAYAIILDDLRAVGLTLDEGITVIRDWFSAAPSAEEQAVIDKAAEAERMRANEKGCSRSRRGAASLPYGGRRRRE